MQRIESLQVARGIAAAMIVVSHAHGAVSKRAVELGAEGTFWFGVQPPVKIFAGVGVDMFLLLAGFFIFYVSWNKPVSRGPYLWGRFLRIYPVWWIALTLYVAISLVPGASAQLTAIDVLLSYTLFPSYAMDGGIKPILEVGWTLYFIVYYYLLYAIFIPLGGFRSLVAITALIGALIILGMAFPFHFALWELITNPRTSGFAIGGWLAFLFLNRNDQYRPAYTGAALAVIAVFAVLFLSSETWRSLDPVITRFPIAVSVMVILSLDPRIRDLPMPPTLMLIGSASYSIYLFHQFPLIVASGLWKRGILVPPEFVPTWVTWAFLTGICIVAGLIAYALFERNVTRLSRPKNAPSLGFGRA